MSDFKAVQLKRSTTTGAVPTANELADGELAINLADKKIYSKNNTVFQVVGAIEDNTIATSKIQDSAITASKLSLDALTLVLSTVYPIGSIYTSTAADNPNTTFGFGTWVAFGTGKVLVGIDSGDTAFNSVEVVGGSKNSVVVEHTHTVSGGAHQHYTVVDGTVGESGDVTPSNSVSERATQSGSSYQSYVMRPGSGTANVGLSSSTNHTHTVNIVGSSSANANLQPYIVVRMWKRTA